MQELGYFYQNVIFQITKYQIPLCCQIFFHVWCNIRGDKSKIQIEEYGDTMHILSNNNGIILCPECVIKELEK